MEPEVVLTIILSEPLQVAQEFRLSAEVVESRQGGGNSVSHG